MEENKSVVTSYRLKEDTKAKIKAQLDEMDLTQEEYFNHVVTLMEMENAKKSNIFAVDTKELQDITQRLYNIFINTCEKGNSFLNNKDKDFEELKLKYKDMLLDKESIITNQKQELQGVYTQISVLQGEVLKYQTQLNNVETEHNKQIEQFESSLKDKTSIIEEYKSKNDTLTGLVNEYKGYKEEREALKEKLDYAKETERTLSGQLDDAKEEVETLTFKLAANNREHDIELNKLKESLEFEKERELLNNDKEHQRKLNELRDDFNAQLDESKRKADVIINQYQKKYTELLEKLEKKESAPKAPKNKKDVKTEGAVEE